MSVASKLFTLLTLLTCQAGCARGFGPLDEEPFADAGLLLDGQAGAVAYASDPEPTGMFEAGAAFIAEGASAAAAATPSLPATPAAPTDANAPASSAKTGAATDAGSAGAPARADAATPSSDSNGASQASNPTAPAVPPIVDAGSAAQNVQTPAEAGTSAPSVLTSPRPAASPQTTVAPSTQTPGSTPVVVDAGALVSSTPAFADAGTISAPTDCTPGLFRGAFDGKIALTASTTFVLSGSIELTLSLATDGQSLQIAHGAVTATGPGGSPLQATVTGYVDCGAAQLREGKLSGSYGQAGSSESLPFAGDASGQYANTPGSLDGAFTANVAGSTVQASGTFSAQRAL